MVTRREFLDTLALGAAGLAIASTAKSYGQILGSNDRLNFAVIGLHGRAYAHLSSLKANKETARISHVCDVDCNTLKKFADDAEQELGYAPATDKDFRHILQLKEVDAITIATPDHWHAPMAIAGVQAGKHVYVEKPCSHNPAEGALLVAGAEEVRQAGADGHAAALLAHTIEIVDKIHNGLIGRAYFAKGVVQQRAQVDRLRQGSSGARAARLGSLAGPRAAPALQRQFQPYNWHWFKIWGTGETLNNGTHEVDVCRWALGVDFPNRITSSGGRYHFKDDWQFYDTLVTSFDIRRQADLLGRQVLRGDEVSTGATAAQPSWERPVRYSSIATAMRSTI